MKNLTDVYLLMRSNSVKSKKTFEENIDEAGDTVALVSDVDLESGIYKGKRILSPPIWTDNLSEIQSEIARIKLQLKDLERLHDKHLNRPSFSIDDTSEERQIESSTRSISQLIHDCQSHISIIKRSSHNKTGLEKQLTDNVVRAVATHLRDVTDTFRQMQTAYCNRITKRNNAGQFFEDTGFEDSTANSSLLQSDMMFVTTQDLLSSEEVAHREQEIQVVVRSINQLNSVFKEVANLVVEQGSVVDRIDYNMENVQTSVQQGLQQLNKAAAYQRKNAKMKCILILAATTVFLIVVLFITKLS